MPHLRSSLASACHLRIQSVLTVLLLAPFQASLAILRQSAWCPCPSRSRRCSQSRRGRTHQHQVGVIACGFFPDARNLAAFRTIASCTCHLYVPSSPATSVLRATQGKWCETRTRQAVTSRACASRSMVSTCCRAAKVRTEQHVQKRQLGCCDGAGVVRWAVPFSSYMLCGRLSVQELWRCAASAAADGSLKLWDLRKFKAPLCTADGLPCNYSMTQVGRQHIACDSSLRRARTTAFKQPYFSSFLHASTFHLLLSCASCPYCRPATALTRSLC